MSTRRALLQGALAAALLGRSRRARTEALPPTLLVLGGTGFIGPHLVECAVRRGWRVTLFNRGKTNPEMFPTLEKLVGDRRNDLKALLGRRFDAAIDTSGNLPSELRLSAGTLAANVKRYLYVSSRAVYAESQGGLLAESAALATQADPQDEQVSEKNYGALKAACEAVVREALPGRALCLRAGDLVGPGDPLDRLAYWLVRSQRGGEMLCPGSAQDALACIDARDFAEFAVLALEQQLEGTYNVDAQPQALTMGRLIEGCRALAPKARPVWAGAGFLAAQGVKPDVELPLWHARRALLDVSKATAAGLKTRPLERTLRDTWSWFSSLGPERREALRAGLAPARELELLQALKAGAAPA